MARLEIPSIVVENGSIPPSAMEHTTARRSQWSRNSKSEEEIDNSDSSDLDRSKSMGREASRIKRGDTTANISPLSRPKTKSNMRLLTRSYAIKESTSPPPDRSLSPVNGPNVINCMENLAITNNNNNIVVNNNSNGRLESQENNKITESQKPAVSVSGSSIEQSSTLSVMDQSGVDVEKFISETLNKNPKDRPIIMKIENELVTLTKDPNRHSFNFGAMSSYQRMLVHRIAHYFGMDHNVDSTGQSVIVNKTKNTRLPDKKFAQFFRDDLPLLEEPRRSILKRDSASFEDTTSFKSSHRHDAESLRRSKSYEEREEEYEKARRRIFHQEHGYNHNSQDMESGYHDPQGWISHAWLCPESEDASKLHPNSNRSSRLKKVESYESKDTLKANSLRSSISKSYSFGGYDQNCQNNRVLTKQDSGSSMSSRVSPLSSGYKSQSLRSDTLSATPSPTATPHLTRQLSNQSATSPEPEQPTVVWAVTNMGSVPAGSVLIDPQSGEPFTNEDGSIYHYDPDNPPNLHGSVMESSSRPRYTNGNGTEKSSEVQEHDGNGRIDETTEEASIPCHGPKDMLVNFELLNQAEMNDAQHQSYQNHSQPAQHSNVISTVAPPAPHFAPGSSQMYSQQQQPPYNYGMGVTQRFSQEGNSQDLSGYMMGLSIGETERLNPSQPHQMCFCNPAHTTAQPAAVPMPQNTGGMAVPMMFGPTAQFQPPSQPPHYVYKYPQNHPPSERTGVECPYSHQPGTQMHTLYRIPPNSQMSAPSLYGSTTNGMAPNCVMGYMQMPAAPTPVTPPRLYHPRMSTPPNTPQNGCAQFPVFTSNYAAPMQSCYPHYQAANVPLTPVLRPALPLNMSNTPPRAAPRYNGPVRSLMHEHSNRARTDANSFNPHYGARHIYQYGNPEGFMMNNSRRPANVQSPGSAIRRRTRS